MIPTTQAHIDLLASRVFWSVDLYEFTFIDGSTLRYAGGGLSVEWDGKTFQGAGPLIKRDSVRLTRGLEADSLSLSIRPKNDDLLMGQPWRDAAANGAFDGASFVLYKGHAATPGAAIVGAVYRFGGPVSDVEIDLDIKLTVSSETMLLSRPTPRAVYQPACDRTLFDGGCGLSRAAFQTTASMLSGSTQSVIQTGLAAVDGYYTGGELRCVSGANAGARRTVKTHEAGGVLTLAYPLSRDVSSGDSFVIWPGCDGTWDTCCAFNNSARFRGQPFVPAPETAY